MQHFYDGQIRRYLTQIVRAFSHFSYKDGDGNLVRIPVMYGDLTRQVANIIRDNSENKIPSAPRMSVYITGLELDRTRLSDSSYVNKINIRERAYDENGQEYLNTQGKSYTVERLMPTPYTLSVNVDVWSTNTDQKLQILEQIMMLFNPSLEIQTTDNYIDWTSLSVLELGTVDFSSRSIPTGTESDIDVATLGFTAPIYISPPTKVKKLGVITDIITSVINLDQGTISLDGFNPDTDTNTSSSDGILDINDIGEGSDYSDNITTDLEGVVYNNGIPINNVSTTPDGKTILADGTIVDEHTIWMTKTLAVNQDGNRITGPVVTSYRNYGLYVENETAILMKNPGFEEKQISWAEIFKAELPAQYQPGISEVRLRRVDRTIPITGTITVNPDNEFEILITWDEDTIPDDTIIEGPVTTGGGIDYFIDPRRFNPTQFKDPGLRLLMIRPIGNKVERKITVSTPTIRFETDLDYYIDDIVKPAGVAEGTSFPSSPTEGDLFYRTDLEKLYVFKATWWLADTVNEFAVYVNNTLVGASLREIDNKVVVQLNQQANEGDVVTYIFNLNDDGPDAWKNADGTDFMADANDIVEWDGSNWHIVLDASETKTFTYVTNLYTKQQYYWNGYIWHLSVDGYYKNGTWSLGL